MFHVSLYKKKKVYMYITVIVPCQLKHCLISEHMLCFVISWHIRIMNLEIED